MSQGTEIRGQSNKVVACSVTTLQILCWLGAGWERVLGTLTVPFVKQLVATGRKTIYWDGEVSGFGLKVTTSGAKTYILQYRMGGRGSPVRTYTIGTHGSPWTPALARDEAKRLKMVISTGVDPQSEKGLRRRERIELEFDAYAKTYINGPLKERSSRSWRLPAGYLQRDCSAAFGGLTMSEITAPRIAALMDSMADRPAARVNCFKALNGLMKWAYGRGDISSAPTQGMRSPSPPPPRDRVLLDSEIAAIWWAAVDRGYPFGDWERLLLLTATRRSECAELDWSELDRGQRLWKLPANRTKNKLATDTPLSAAAVLLLDTIAVRFRGGSGQTPSDADLQWPRRGPVFTANGENHIRGFSVAKAMLDHAVMAKLSAWSAQAGEGDLPSSERWTFHDFRRAVATHLQRDGVPIAVAEAVLNHVSGSRAGLVGIYNRYEYRSEKRAALERWAEILDGITTRFDCPESRHKLEAAVSQGRAASLA